MVDAVVPSAGMLVGAALTVTVAGASGSGVKVTVAGLLVTGVVVPAEAVTVTVPTVPLVRVTVATPLALVVAVAALRVPIPLVILKVTVATGFGALPLVTLLGPPPTTPTMAFRVTL